jgi:hypothetical protein
MGPWSIQVTAETMITILKSVSQVGCFQGSVIVANLTTHGTPPCGRSGFVSDNTETLEIAQPQTVVSHVGRDFPWFR